MTVIDALHLNGSWRVLTRDEVAMRWQTRALGVTSEKLILEQSGGLPCECLLLAEFDNGVLSSIRLSRNGATRSATLKDANDLADLLRRTDQAPEIVAGPADSQRHIWILPEEDRTARQLGFDVEVSPCGKVWNLSARITLFRFRKAIAVNQ
jgi:hypothetical protein